MARSVLSPSAEVQKILGHASVVTTQIYAHLEYQNLRNAVETIQLTDSASTRSPNNCRPSLVC